MTKTPETAEAAKVTVERIKENTKKKLGEAKSMTGLGEMFKELMENLKAGKGKEVLKNATAIIVAIFSGKLAGLKKEVEKNKKESEKKASPKKPEKEPEEDTGKIVKMPSAVATGTLPEGLDGTKYNSENILKCTTIEQCRALMKANGFILDRASGNYINPRWLSPDKILQEPLVEDSIGGHTVRLKQSVMARLKRADQKMYAETGEHIQVGENFRSNAHQFELYKEMKPKNWRVAPPGSSFHEIGQAIDVPGNWEKAQKYLWAEGFIGGKQPIGLRGDANHFSIGEIKMNDTRIAALKEEDVDVKKAS